MTGGCLDDALEKLVVFTTTKIIAGVLFANLDTDAIGLRWVCAFSKEQKL